MNASIMVLVLVLFPCRTSRTCPAHTCPLVVKLPGPGGLALNLVGGFLLVPSVLGETLLDNISDQSGFYAQTFY